MVALKRDAAHIQAFLKELARQEWLGGSERRWWPRYAFHYTDLRNAVAILEDGYLYSRREAERLGRLHVSSGSATVLAGTADDIKACVRLYFRPQTPTQWYAEGIRSSK